ncbi:MAG: LysM peptidoglycan-binding domain-containing protein [Lachnospiraceae bacterium]|nr:LysM peptidoglycan-binding domain-containing protein [Lachnospiraceae bacterium]
MEIWLKQGKNALRLPILPQEVGQSSEQDNKTEVVNALGEVNLLGLPKLETVQLESHFPQKPMYYDQYRGYKSPQKCVQLVEKMKQNGVIRFIITPLINYEATIESFEWKFTDGTGDIYYTIQLKKYRRPVKKRNKKKPKKITVTVKKGDTWAKLAKKYTGSSKNAKKIAKQNKMSNKKKPPVGKKVTITP